MPLSRAIMLPHLRQLTIQRRRCSAVPATSGKGENPPDSSAHSTTTVEHDITTTSCCRPAKLLSSDSSNSSCCSSTVSSTSSSSDESSSTSTASTKRVRFNLEASATKWHPSSVEYYNYGDGGDGGDGGDDDDLDLRSMWYLSDEVNYFKDESAHFGKLVQKEERGSPNSYTQTLIKTYKACCDRAAVEEENEGAALSPACRRKLKRWLEVCTDRLGAELCCVRFLRQQKRDRQREMVASVLEHQHLAAECGDDDDDARRRSLRESCERVSLPSRIFARAIAEAYYEGGQ